jgi:hypothetical protein
VVNSKPSKPLNVDRCHHRQMVRSDAGYGRDVRLHLDQRGTRSDPNAIERKKRKKRREASEARRLAEFLIESQDWRSEGKPLVEIERYDRRTGPVRRGRRCQYRRQWRRALRVLESSDRDDGREPPNGASIGRCRIRCRIS